MRTQCMRASFAVGQVTPHRGHGVGLRGGPPRVLRFAARLRKNFMSKIHVLARYVHVPAWTAAGKPLNFDLSRSANPSHMDVSVESLASEVEALAWFASQDDHSGACIFPLASLTPADRARVRRAMARRQA